MQRAETLSDAYKTLSPKPLIEPGEFQSFYKSELNKIRGKDLVAFMSLGLNRSWGTIPYKALLMGHSGVGKSTEMTRLADNLAGKYRVIRFSATEQLDPVSFQPFDVLLLMMIEVAERTAKTVKEGGAGKKPSDDRLREIYDWFAVETETIKRATEAAAKAEAGAGVSGESWWAKALGLFGSIKGEIRYASTREKETVTYRLSRLDELIKAVNRLLAECNKLMREATGCEWLFIAEDFDKAGIDPRHIEDLFVTYCNVLKELDAHFIFNIPIALGHSPKAAAFPVPHDKIFAVPDTMVYGKDHTPHVEGRAAITAVLEARIAPDLFAPGQMDRLIVGSGGNLRNLFAMTSSAGDTALLRGASRIEDDDVTAALRDLRSRYESALGENPYDVDISSDGRPKPIPYEQKAARLLRIYEQEPTAKVPDPVLYSLLRSRAVQEFNGEKWFGVHPLVVDILATQGKLQKPSSGIVPGGSE